MKNLIKKTNPKSTKDLSSDKNKSVDIINEFNILTCGSICRGIHSFEDMLKNIFPHIILSQLTNPYRVSNV